MSRAPRFVDGDRESVARQTLQSATSGVVIVAHREDTTALRRTLIAEGFLVDEVRGPYSAEQRQFSASMRCLVNHANAWRIAAARPLPTIVIEADFVPVRGFGELPLPMPLEKLGNSLGYLYSVGPQIWDLATPDVARGHGGGMVALAIPPNVASLLLKFCDHTLMANPSGKYSPFDSKVGYWLMEHGVESYIPYRHYGEHGGLGNPEHTQAGLGRPHQADVLQGRIAFPPSYAKGSILRLWSVRMRARAWGALRLLTGRLLAPHDLARGNRQELLRFALGRLLIATRPRPRPNQALEKVGQ